jgi:hypothetical protein
MITTRNRLIMVVRENLSKITRILGLYKDSLIKILKPINLQIRLKQIKYNINSTIRAQSCNW